MFLWEKATACYRVSSYLFVEKRVIRSRVTLIGKENSLSLSLSLFLPLNSQFLDNWDSRARWFRWSRKAFSATNEPSPSLVPLLLIFSLSSFLEDFSSRQAKYDYTYQCLFWISDVSYKGQRSELMNKMCIEWIKTWINEWMLLIIFKLFKDGNPIRAPVAQHLQIGTLTIDHQPETGNIWQMCTWNWIEILDFNDGWLPKNKLRES